MQFWSMQFELDYCSKMMPDTKCQGFQTQIRCKSEKEGVTPSREPEASSIPQVPSCESPEQVTYWKGLEARGPVWPDGPLQFKETASASVS